MPLLGTVVWHEGHRGHERPVAVIVGGERSDVELEEAWTEGPARAGAAPVRVFVVRGAHGRRLRIAQESGREARLEVAAEA
jgi:hypothetical protein